MLLIALYHALPAVPGPAGGGLDAQVAAAVFAHQQTMDSKQSTGLETFANKSELPSLTYIKPIAYIQLITKSGLVPSMSPVAQHTRQAAAQSRVQPAPPRERVGSGDETSTSRCEAPDEIAHALFDHFMVSSVFLHNQAQNIPREHYLCHRSCSCSLVSRRFCSTFIPKASA